MRAVSILALGAALVASNAQAQVISRSVSEEPVETIVTQTPDGTVVTRRPIGTEGPASIDSITTREVVRRVETRPAPQVTRPVPPATTRITRERKAAKAVRERPARELVTRDVRLSAPATITLTPAERRIVYQTIVEREVVPQPRVVAPAYPPPGYQTWRDQNWREPVVVTPPVVAADDDIEMTTPTYAVGAVLPRGVPLFAVPQEVGYRVPAASPYSYAYVGGRAYLVDPGSGAVVADVTE
jgi:hypothetical protein